MGIAGAWAGHGVLFPTALAAIPGRSFHLHGSIPGSLSGGVAGSLAGCRRGIHVFELKSRTDLCIAVHKACQAGAVLETNFDLPQLPVRRPLLFSDFGYCSSLNSPFGSDFG
jgi:hypothetical protein